MPVPIFFIAALLNPSEWNCIGNQRYLPYFSNDQSFNTQEEAHQKRLLSSLGNKAKNFNHAEFVTKSPRPSVYLPE